MGIFSAFSNRLANKIGNAVAEKAAETLIPHAQEITADIIDSFVENINKPQERTTGGMTKLYLPQIEKDFKDFHAEDADTDIKTFITEYLLIMYGNQESFEKAKVSDKVKMNINKKKNGKIVNLEVHDVVIAYYKKSLNAATIKYRASVGYATEQTKIEELYEVEYTLQLRNEFEEETFLKCQNCGAPLRETDGVCPYCGMKHIRDTIMSWVVTDVMKM